LGGAALATWLIMSIGQALRGDYETIELHFGQIAAIFGFMMIFCNYPHFMMTYRLGYGRGLKFILQHWFALIAAPALLVLMYAVGYFASDTNILDWPGVSLINSSLSTLGLDFRLGTLPNPAIEILSLSIWLMYITVGWHYSKQVFGCMMVYSHFDRYPLTVFQRRAIKASVFSIATMNFFVSSIYAPEYGYWAARQMYFLNVALVPLGLPHILLPISAAIALVSTVVAIRSVFLHNWKRLRLKPSLNLLVPWIALYVWYIPYGRQMEYYLWLVPFFHSLQYLPFAYRMEAPGIARSRRPEVVATLSLAALILVGFLTFELFPILLDKGFETNWNKKAQFFLISVAVFINIHHYFIDSVVWKFDQPEVRKNILEAA
jgi:hypothetical protein